MPPTGFEPAIPAIKRLQTYVYRTASGIILAVKLSGSQVKNVTATLGASNGVLLQCDVTLTLFIPRHN